MDVKQEHGETHGCVIKTEPILIYHLTEENYSLPIKCKSEDDGEISDMVGISKFKQDIEFEQSSDFTLIIPTTVKQELENVAKTEVADIFSMKQEVCEDIMFRHESEFLTSDCDLPTLKSENNDHPDSLTQSCSSEALSENCSYQHPCIADQKNDPAAQSRSNQIDGHFKNHFVLKQNSVLPQLPNDSIINSSEKLFKCEICSKEFNKEFRLKEHVADHSYRFYCNICHIKFKRNSELQTHSCIYSNEEDQFKCDICSKEFKIRRYLLKHLKIHTDVKPFKCNVCSKEFRSKPSLQVHLTVHSDKKPFKCDICFREFTHQVILQTHVKAHERLFKCDICSKRFSHKSKLQTHVKIHTNERLFKCDICSRGFNRKDHLQQHLIIHNNKKKIFECNICFKGFTRKTNLERHVIVIHSDKN